MCRKFFVCWFLGLSVQIPCAVADTHPLVQSTLGEVIAAYMAGDFETAFVRLAAVRGLLGVVPILDQPEPDVRAQVFFDLGRIRLAAGDTARARVVLAHVFELDPYARKGLMQVPSDSALDETRSFLARLRKQERNRRLRSASKWGGALRSLVVPGWGQVYRGHKKRGHILMGTAVGLAAFWAVSDHSYRSAYRTYRNTRLEDLTLGNRTGTGSDPQPFQARFERAQSRARRANIALSMLAAVWMSSVLDNLVVGPAQLSVVVPIR